MCLEKLFFCYKNRIWRDMTYSEAISFHFFYFLSQSTIPVASKRGIKDISQKKKKIDFQFLFLLWPTNNMFILKEAYFCLSSLNCINCFLTKETTALLIMKGSFLCEDQYELKSYILRGPGYNHCWTSAVNNLAKCRKCFY